MHPITSDRLRSFLVQHSIITLIIIYLVINILIAVVIGSVLWVSANGQSNFVSWFEYALLSLFNAAPDLEIDLSGFQRLIRVIEASLSVTLPAILLGTIVFKLLVKPKIIIFRKNAQYTIAIPKKAWLWQ